MQSRKTMEGGTRTSRGLIPNLHHNGVTMPVKVRPYKNRPDDLPMPVVRDGHLVFALPGGGEYISPYTLEEWYANRQLRSEAA